MRVEEEKLMSQHVNIRPGAKQIKETGTLPPSPTPDPLTREDLTYTEALPIWLAHEKEAFQITAVMIDLTARRALTERTSYPPFGLMKYTLGKLNLEELDPVTKLENLTDLRRAMKESLGWAENKVITDLKKKDRESIPDPMVRVYKRYVKLYEFAQLYIGGALDFPLSIEAGINTASNRMTWTLENILDVWQREIPDREPTLEEFLTIARNSFVYIARLSSMHRHEFGDTSSDPKYHTLVSTPDGYMLDYTKNAKAKFKKDSKKRQVSDRSKRPKYKCPAFVDFGDGSAIKKLWDWHIELAEQIYTTHYNGESVYKLLEAA